MSIFELIQADSPLVISVPHDGALIPDEVLVTMKPGILESTDRDYLIDPVFEFTDLKYSKISANYSRHLIDLNRPASGEALYSNQAETELCPTSTFDFQTIYQAGKEPDQTEVNRRIELYWQPYHDQLNAMIQTAVQNHGYCLLIDAHSIDDEVPRFFEGHLPDINVGTFSGQSCAAEYEHLVNEMLTAQSEFSHVVNGRFKGGHITRHYGRPHQHVHAIQLEHAKSCYLDPDLSLSTKSEILRQLWKNILRNLLSVHRS